MKISDKILIFLSMTAVMAGCNKSYLTTGGDEIEVEIGNHYIHFDTGITTRASLYEHDDNILEADFYVLGYQYKGAWGTYKVQAEPNVFYTNAENPQLQLPLYVDYEEGIYSYSNPQKWTGNTYSFFGYYPTNNTNITLFERDNDGNLLTEGEPYIIYDISGSNKTVDPDKMVDVMTATSIEKTLLGAIQSDGVVMDFKHRLSAIEVCARNYYEGFDHDNDGDAENPTPRKPVSVEITDLGIELSNITYTSAYIYLDHTRSPLTTDKKATPVAGGAKLTYQYVNSTNPVEIKPNIGLQYVSKDEDIMLLIPQSDYLNCKLTSLSFRTKYQDDSGKWVKLSDTTYPVTDFKFTKELLESHRYYIDLTFTSDAVSVNISATEEWDRKDDIKHTFE